MRAGGIAAIRSSGSPRGSFVDDPLGRIAGTVNEQSIRLYRMRESSSREKSRLPKDVAINLEEEEEEEEAKRYYLIDVDDDDDEEEAQKLGELDPRKVPMIKCTRA